MIRNKEFSRTKMSRVWTIVLFLYSTVLKCQGPKSCLQLVKNVRLLNVSCFDFTSSHCFLACA